MAGWLSIFRYLCLIHGVVFCGNFSVNSTCPNFKVWFSSILIVQSGARFSKVPIINGPGKLSPFTLKIEVSIVLHLT